jgi:pimeloyl-ACP methyl ester carboxylesterase
MTVHTTRNGEVEIAYETFGTADGTPLLLLNGLDYQMIWIHNDLCAMLADRGFHVARFDYRDTGLSTHADATSSRSAWKALLAGSKDVPYRGQDLLEDCIAVLDALGWDSANLLGVSMGAGIAQHLAIRHPKRVRSLTLVAGLPMSTSPAASLRYMHLGAFFKLALRRYGKDRADQERMLVDILRATYTPAYPLEEDWAKRIATISYDRMPPDPAARARQLSAGRTLKATAQDLAAITAPTLVIHGESDPLIKPTAAHALTSAIPGARMVTYAGMGHGLPRQLWPRVIDELTALTANPAAHAHTPPTKPGLA